MAQGTAVKTAPETVVTRSPLIRANELHDELASRYPESKDAFGELGDTYAAIWNDGWEQGAKAQGRMILGLLSGEAVAWRSGRRLTVDGAIPESDALATLRDELSPR